LMRKLRKREYVLREIADKKELRLKNEYSFAQACKRSSQKNAL